MKKLTYLFLSTLIIGAIIALVNHEPTSAIMKTSDGRTWYSAKEMTAVIENEMAKISLYCEETDYDCWNKIYEARASSDNRFFITDFFSAKMFVPTIINHEEKTITGVFHNGSFLEHSYPDLTGYQIDGVYLAWFDYPTYGIFENLQNFKNDEEVEGMHQIYKQRSHEQYIPLVTEYEMPLLDRLPDDYEINYHVAGGNFTSTGIYNYSNCINSELYTPGMECRFMMSEDMGSEYFPFWPGDESDTDLSFLDEDDSIDYEQLLHPYDPFQDFPDEPEPNPTPDEPESIIEEIPEDIDEPTPNEPILASLGDASEPELVPSAPNTGVNRELICEKTIEFPWWITLLVALGEILIIWWFAPTYKNHKNSKKS